MDSLITYMKLESIHWFFLILITLVFVVLSHPPFSFGLLMFVGLVPFFIALERAPNWKAAFFRGWVLAFLGNSAICYWIAHTMHEFAGLPWLLSIPMVFALSLAEQLSWPLMAAARHLVHKHLGIRPLFWTPLAMLVLEFLWPKLWSNTLGSVFYANEWLRQVADITGVWGLTAIIIASNECIAVLILKSWPKRDLRRHTIATASMLILAIGYGAYRHAEIQDYKHRNNDFIRIALIQPNFNSVSRVQGSINPERTKIDIVDELLAQSQLAVNNHPDLIFWPETVVPTPYHSNSVYERPAITRKIDDFVKTHATSLLFGARHYESNRNYNSLYMVNADARDLAIQRYDKNILLLFGETIPLADYSPAWRQFLLNHGAAIYSRGPGATLLHHDKARLGAMICYEGLFPGYIREIANDGAQVLVNATNDSWYGNTTEPDLHLYLTAFRSIETRRPLVRVTNTGYSSVIDIDGSLRVKSNLNTSVNLVHDVPVYPEITSPYLVIGNALIYVAAIWSVVRIAPTFWRRRRKDS